MRINARMINVSFYFFFSSRRRHTRWTGDWSSDVLFRSLVLRQYAPVDHFAFHIAATNIGDPQFDEAIGEQNAGARPDFLRQPGECGGDQAGGAGKEIGRASCRERVEISGGAAAGAEERG